MSDTDPPSARPRAAPRPPVAGEVSRATGPAKTPPSSEAERGRQAADRLNNGQRPATPR